MVTLLVGLHPSAVDYGRYPGLDEQMLTARIAAGEAALHEAGLDIVTCQVPADPDEAEATVRACVAGRSIETVMIGAGLRMAPEHTLLFERTVNLLIRLVPGVRFCFNTSPENTIDAVRRGNRQV